VKVQAADFSFSPTDIDLAADKATTLEIDNAGKVEHNMTIEGTDVNKDLEAGETTKVSVTVKAGTYKFHCKYHPTQMKGTVTVK
jgi:plastocyanin